MRHDRLLHGSQYRTLSAFLCCLLTASASLAADPLIDLTLFNPPEISQRKLQEPVVTWVVSPQASTYCSRVAIKDGFLTRHESCAYWTLNDKKCVVVTTNSTSHSELGHLFVSCLRGAGSP